MIDFHSHILPAIDDGAVNIDESIAMAKELADFGYKTVCCTPHCIKGYYDLTPQQVREATLMLQADLDNADIHLELWPGMEYMLDECFAEFADDLQPLGDTRLILCEAPPQAHPGVVLENLQLIVDKGYVPLIAHPERTEYFYQKLCSSDRITGEIRDAGRGRRNVQPLQKQASLFQRFWPFASRGPRPAPLVLENPHPAFSASDIPHLAITEFCLFQANFGSFTGFYGEVVQHRAYDLLKRGIYSALASDLHDSGSASRALMKEKFEMNPLLKKLSDFDGSAEAPGKITKGTVDAGQGELF